MSFRTRLILSLLLFSGLIFFVMLRRSLNDIRPQFLEAMEDSTADTATLLASTVTYDASRGLNCAKLSQILERAKRDAVVEPLFGTVKKSFILRALVSNAQGVVVFDSQQGKRVGQDVSRWNDIVRALRGEYGARSTHEDPRVPTASVKYISVPIRDAGKVVGALTLAKPSRAFIPFLASAKRSVITAALWLFLVTLCVAFLLSLWITHPVKGLTRYAEQVRDGKNAKLPRLGPTEFKTMGTALESMREALEGKKYVESYTQTLAHELKSPLSAIRGAAEILLEEPPEPDRSRFLQNIHSETTRISELVDQMLLLAYLDARPSGGQGEAFSLKSLLEELCESFTPQVKKKSLRLSLCAEEAVVRGDRFLIRQAFANLLQNAIDFSPERGTLKVSLSLANAMASVIIADEGPGIPTQAMTKIFDRFFSLPRPDTQRRSSGLGLSLVREVALRHQGQILLENLLPQGTQALFRLPL